MFGSEKTLRRGMLEEKNQHGWLITGNNTTWCARAVFNLVPVNNILQTAKIRLLMVGHTILKRWVAEPMIHKTAGIVVTHNLYRMQEQPTDLSLWKLLSTPKKCLRALVTEFEVCGGGWYE